MKLHLFSFVLAAAIAPAFAADIVAPPAGKGAEATRADVESEEPFSFEERGLLLALYGDVTNALMASGLPANVPVSALPFPGDRDRYLEGLLKNAVTAAGLTYVEGRGDPMWDAIVDEIIWDEHKNDVLDDATLTKFGRLQAARQLLYGRLILDYGTNDLPRAELWLHVSSVETKRHVWGKTFVCAPMPIPPPAPTNIITFVNFPTVLVDVPLSVCVASGPADSDSDSSAALAGAMGSDARDTLAANGFAVFDARAALVATGLSVIEGGAAKDTEIALSIKSSAPAFDREDDYVRFGGTVKLVATVPADGNRILGEKTIRVIRSKRALGEEAALANLREDLVPALRAWLGETITAEKAGLRSVTVQTDFIKLDEPELEQRIATLVDAAAHLDGVRDARVVSRLPLPNGESGTRITLRVLFRPVDVPEGIATRLVAERPDLFKKVVPGETQK